MIHKNYNYLITSLKYLCKYFALKINENPLHKETIDTIEICKTCLSKHEVHYSKHEIHFVV